MKHSNTLLVSGIILLGTFYFAMFIGAYPLFDWDEINFAECSREMLESGNFWDVQLYYKPFWEKPPLFIWIEACSMKLFGVNAFAARIPNAVCGGITLGLMAVWSLRYYSKLFCITWITILLGCALPLLYFKSGIIDPWFNLFILLALFLSIEKPYSFIKTLMSGLFLGAAVLTKGPVAFLLFYLSIAVFYSIKKEFRYFYSKSFWILLLSSVAVPVCWILSALLTGKANVLSAFIDYQIRLFNTEDSGHGGSFLFHPLVILLGCFPASLLLFRSVSTAPRETPTYNIRLLMMVVTCVVLFIFGIVKTKIIHYSSLAYIPVSFLMADNLMRIQTKPKRFWNALYLIICICIAIGLMSISLFPLWQPLVIKWLKPYSFEWYLLHKINPISIGSVISAIAVAVCMIVFWYFINTLQHTKLLKSGIALSLCFHVFMCFNIPTIGLYSQADLIDLCTTYGSQGYIETYNFKSYAPLFYGKASYQDFILPQRLNEIADIEKKLQKSNLDPATHPGLVHQIWIEESKTTQKPRFIICKRNSESILQGHRNYIFLEHRGAYSIYRVE